METATQNQKMILSIKLTWSQYDELKQGKKITFRQSLAQGMTYTIHVRARDKEDGSSGRYITQTKEFIVSICNIELREPLMQRITGKFVDGLAENPCNSFAIDFQE